MNSQSQLEWFYTLPNIVKTNSSKPKVKWLTANRAKANIIRISKEQKVEAAIAFILYRDLQTAVQDKIVVENWTAFLSRYSYKAANEVRTIMLKYGLITTSETAIFEDNFLIALSFCVEPLAFLKNFSCHEASTEIWYKVLHGYCRKTAKGKLIDRIRSQEGSKTFMRSNLGLAARYEESKIIESLLLVGIKDAELEKHLFVWRCFIEVKQAHKINTKSPKPEDFQLVAQRVNYLSNRNQSDRTLFSTAILDDTVKACLTQVGEALRYCIDRPKLSFDRLISQDSQTSLLDIIPDDNSNTDLASVETSSTMDRINSLVYDYLEQIDSAQWLTLFLREEANLKQTDIAIMIDCTQKTVSKKYRKSWQDLLKKVITELQSAAGISTQLSSESITDLKEGLINVVKSYFQSTLQNHYQISSQASNLTAKQLVEFLQHRSNIQSLTLNCDLQKKLEDFIETADYLT